MLLAVAGVVLDGLVPAFGGTPNGRLEIWLPLVVRLAGVLCISAAALRGPRALTTRRWGPFHLGPALGVTAVAAVVLRWQAADLPTALPQQLSPRAVSERLAAGHPLLTASMVLSAACFGFAAIAFTLQAREERDEVLLWLGPACALAMFARINYVLFPSLYSDWLYAGDLLRVGFYLVLLIGAAREINRYWAAQAQVAVFDDRRRMARELHDGVVQELGYIRAETRSFLPSDPGRTKRVLGACDRALDETRQAVEVLGHAADEPVGFALHRAGRQVADRHQLALELEVDDSIQAGQQQRHALLRIVREAVSNAARHGEASRVRITLTRSQTGQVLTVLDDGAGFDVATALSRPGGFGLTSMRERAKGLPGEFQVRSQPGAGSEVTVRW